MAKGEKKHWHGAGVLRTKKGNVQPGGEIPEGVEFSEKRLAKFGDRIGGPRAVVSAPIPPGIAELKARIAELEVVKPGKAASEKIEKLTAEIADLRTENEAISAELAQAKEALSAVGGGQ